MRAFARELQRSRRKSVSVTGVTAGIPGGLPQAYDANFSPVAPSGAVGAKIWLVLSDDVECEATDTGEVDENEEPVYAAHMVGWNPASYLFEGNLIVYQHVAPVVVEEEEETEPQEVAESAQATQNPDSAAPAPQGGSESKGQGLARGKNK
jgi:hypothetical protein